MIKIYNWARQSGKTTRVINEMYKDDNLILLVPIEGHRRFYPPEFHHRIFSAGVREEDLINQFRGRYIRRVILDEGFMYNITKMVKLYYLLGRYGLDVITYGTTYDKEAATPRYSRQITESFQALRDLETRHQVNRDIQGEHQALEALMFAAEYESKWADEREEYPEANQPSAIGGAACSPDPSSRADDEAQGVDGGATEWGNPTPNGFDWGKQAGDEEPPQGE